MDRRDSILDQLKTQCYRFLIAMIISKYLKRTVKTREITNQLFTVEFR